MPVFSTCLSLSPKLTRKTLYLACQVLTPLEARYQAIVSRENLKAIYMDAKVLHAQGLLASATVSLVYLHLASRTVP